MVALDGHGFLALGAARLDHVGVNRALRQERRALVPAVSGFEFRGLFFEHVDKQTTNDLAFGFGLTHSSQFTQEHITGIHPNDVCMQLADKHVHDHVALVQA